MPLSLAMDGGELNHIGGGGGGGGLMAAAVVAVTAMDDRDLWQWRWMAATALDRGHTTTSQCSKSLAL